MLLLKLDDHLAPLLLPPMPLSFKLVTGGLALNLERICLPHGGLSAVGRLARLAQVALHRLDALQGLVKALLELVYLALLVVGSYLLRASRAQRDSQAARADPIHLRLLGKLQLRRELRVFLLKVDEVSA